MKKSGGDRGPRRATYDLFYVAGARIEVGSQIGDGISGVEAGENVLHPCSTSHQQRLPERSPRIGDDLGLAEGRQLDARGEVVFPVRDELQVIAHEVAELLLPSADHGELEELLVATV